MNDEEIKENLTAAGVSIEFAIENLQNALGGPNLFLNELILQSIPVLVEQERKLTLLRSHMEPENSQKC